MREGAVVGKAPWGGGFSQGPGPLPCLLPSPLPRCDHQGWSVPSTEVVRTKCGLSKPCPDNFFAFKISSGAANVVGPTMCFENRV